MTKEAPDLRQRYRLPSRRVAHLFESATTESDYYEPDLAGLGYVPRTYRPLCFALTGNAARYLDHALVSDPEAPACHRCTLVSDHLPSRPPERAGRWHRSAWEQSLRVVAGELDRALGKK